MADFTDWLDRRKRMIAEDVKGLTWQDVLGWRGRLGWRTFTGAVRTGCVKPLQDGTAGLRQAAAAALDRESDAELRWLAREVYKLDLMIEGAAFVAEMRRLGVTPADTRATNRVHVATAYIALTFVVAALAHVAYQITHWLGSPQQVVTIAVSLLFCGPLVALFLKHSFRSWQIRHRILGGLRRFLRSPADWFPY